MECIEDIFLRREKQFALRAHLQRLVDIEEILTDAILVILQCPMLAQWLSERERSAEKQAYLKDQLHKIKYIFLVFNKLAIRLIFYKRYKPCDKSTNLIVNY